MKKRFWIYLIVHVILMAILAVMSIFLLIPDAFRNIPDIPDYAYYIFDAVILAIFLLANPILRKLKKIEVEAGEDSNKAMLKRYNVIDWILLGFIGLLLFSLLIYRIRSWIP